MSLLSLIRGQQQLDDHDVALLAGATSSDLPLTGIVSRDVDVRTVRIIGKPVTRRYGLEFVVRSLLQARRWAKGYRPTVLHGHSGRWHYSLATNLLARQLGCAWVHTFYCPIPHQPPPHRLEGWVMRKTLRHASALAGISQNILHSMTEVGVSTDRLYHIDPCIDTATYHPVASSSTVRRQLEIPPDAQIILFVGSTHPSKGFDILWRALAILRDSGLNPYLVATFESFGHSYTTEIVGPPGLENIATTRFLGVVDNMPALMHAADVLVVPFRSTYGPSDYPLPMLEAMSVGTPVIAADVGGICEVIRDGQTGFLVPPDNPSRLASALEQFLTHSVSADGLAEAARILVDERFAPSVGARRWRRLYEEI